MGTATKVPEPLETTKTTVEEYPAPAIVRQQALLQDWPAEFKRFQSDPDKFWEDIAKQFVWSKPWDKVFEWDGIHHKWFYGRAHQHHGQCARPARQLREPQQSSIHLAGRRRHRDDRHLRPVVPRCLSLRERTEVPGGEEGRSRRHLHAADAGRRDFHAGLCAHRRHSLRGLCRTRAHLAA